MLTHIFCSVTTNCSFLAYFSFLPRMTFLQIEEVYLFPDLELTFLSRFFYQVLCAQKSQFLLESHSWLFSSAALINLGYWDNLCVLSQSPRSASCSYSEVQFAQNLWNVCVIPHCFQLLLLPFCPENGQSSCLGRKMLQGTLLCFLQQRLPTVKICKVCCQPIQRCGLTIINLL